jgi:hypothetical protein
MTRNLKVLVLGLVAALALAAVGASSASAITQFNSESETTSFSGKQTGTAKFTTDPGSIECTGGTFRGMITKTVQTNVETSESTATSGPEVGKKGIEYSGCTFLGFVGVTVNNNGCQYNFHTNGTVDIINGGGSCSTEGITFNGGGCKVHVKPQTGLSGVTYTNGGSGTTRTITVQPNPVKEITYTAEGCITGGNGTHSDGVYGDGSTKGSSSVPVGGTTTTNEGMTSKGVFTS